MCVAFLALDRHPRWRVILATNRDEGYARPTRPASRWPECPRVIAGLDEEAGGTWFGVREQPEAAPAWTLVTNVRDLPAHRDGAQSRGDLTREYLCGDDRPSAYVHDAHSRRADFNPFNLLVAQGEEVWYASTRTPTPERLATGLYGLSNATLDEPWPKVTRGKRLLREWLLKTDLDPDDLFSLLDDAEPAPDADLPDTGVGLELERVLSSVFIASPGYGTRAQSVLLIDHDGSGLFVERTTTPGASREVRTFTLGSRSSGVAP